MPVSHDEIILKNYPSRCGERQSTIVSKDQDHRWKHVGYNDSKGRVRHYKIDGEVLPKNKKPDRCDFLLLTDDTTPPTAYFIELKGSLADAEKCIEQVENTERMCKNSIKNYRVLYRFVFGTGHGGYSSGFIKWRDKQPKGKVLAQRNVVEDHF